MSDTDSKSATPTVYAPKLYLDEPDRTAEALATFRPLESCRYSIDYLGDSTNEFMECDCPEERTLVGDDEYINHACDENSDCINRLTLIECVDGLCESTCGKECQNQRFQRKQYADINVFLTEHKGYGVRAQSNLEANTFIYEYIGEVIDEEEFRDRMVQYDERHFKHFYFMMLQTGQFIDATMKGCLARFCNHSCNPNAYVNKWVVNGKLKMGIFAKRDIQKGEEITFDYNVDRYGATAQKCYCGESNCIGFMGGKTQTDAASLLPHIYSDAMGVSASQEKKWIKIKKAEGTLNDLKNKNENGENINIEFVESLIMEPCDNVKDVTKVMSVLLQCNNKLIASMLFKRLWLTYNYEDEDDEDKNLKQLLLNQVIKLHGYQCFKNLFQLFQDNDDDILSDIIEFLYHLPKSTKNGIISSHIDTEVKVIGDEYPDLLEDCNKLLQKWDTFDTYTRITKKDISNVSSTTSMKKLMDQRRIRLPPGWEIIQENGRPLYFNREQNRKLIDPPISHSDNNKQPVSLDRRNRSLINRHNHNNTIKNNSEHRLGDKRSYSSRDLHQSEDFVKKKKRIELEEQQALLRAKEEDEKREKERFQQETERRNILNQIISDVGKSKELEREQSLKLEEEKKRKHIERKANSQLSHLEHKWEKFFASFVPNMVKKYNTDVNLSHDAIKQCARDIVKTLSTKEAKRGSNNSPPEKMDKYKHEKVKSFVNQYMGKFIQKYKDKKFKTSHAS
ncbi:similar to Saccharomyces cerevisiae YJL168C SET2 Histone methyltransferase with a role in transcriptional elongation, methylates a lysine residue of histone H3 [Maudiozyma saulgeensis]|uniref:Histone-lysine N-methyltransferase, H3 lysine-36 specific n=1 Tax=Maudiozyma saulgeensis TaxID=1789683 RepID=A0A1X7R9P6_9SACH|nr:similar to Saccharomyces cerevisiae YJL168C SET2 Histone methyltransferase with a role in transcriptional elongation, methylates a lysine residue of histone H3 [Kazachstania saulgeensis]